MKKILIVIALVAITLPTWGATYYMATTGTEHAGRSSGRSAPARGAVYECTG